MKPTSEGVGGCGRKVPISLLASLLEPLTQRIARVPIRGDVREIRDLGDACLIGLRAPVDALTTSADLLYSMSESPYRFGYTAAIHALSDLFATLAQPLYGTLTLGTSNVALKAGEAAETLRGAADALHEHGAAVAGGHTIFATDAFLNVAVTGRPRAGPLSGACAPGDRIVLWKPLGTGLALTACKLGVANENELPREFGMMERSNRDASDILVQLERTAPGSIRAVGDVSGFGFLETLRRLIGNAIADVDASRVPYFERSAFFVAEGCWSGLADANLAASLEYTAYEDLGVHDGLIPALLNDPQTSGGLVAVIDPASWASVAEDQAGFDARDVGAITAIGGGPRVTVRRVAS